MLIAGVAAAVLELPLPKEKAVFVVLVMEVWNVLSTLLVLATIGAALLVVFHIGIEVITAGGDVVKLDVLVVMLADEVREVGELM